MRRIAMLLGGLLIGALAVVLIFILGMRAHSRLVVTAIRRINRAVFNPQQMRSAGTEGAYASVIRHRGRISGRPYETPVGAVATDDGFVIALPYGTQADWVKNVLAAGSAEVLDEGSTYRVDRAEIVSMRDAADHFSESDRRSHRLFGVDRCLRLRRIEVA